MPYLLKWNCKDRYNYNYQLNTVDLSNAHFDDLEGVYVIWYQVETGRKIVYIGDGEIRDRLSTHREDEQIQTYAPETLFVAWASAPVTDRNRIVKFLYQRLKPLVQDKIPDVSPKYVTLPFGF